jgi:threonine/homoserine/homoserine lactone efflux protein
MTLFNPMTLAFWFTVVPGQIPRGDAPNSPTGGLPALPVVCAGVFLGTVSWVISFAGLLGWAGRYRKRVWLAAADAVGGVILLGFGIVGLLRLLRSFL